MTIKEKLYYIARRFFSFYLVERNTPGIYLGNIAVNYDDFKTNFVPYFAVHSYVGTRQNKDIEHTKIYDLIRANNSFEEVKNLVNFLYNSCSRGTLYPIKYENTKYYVNNYMVLDEKLNVIFIAGAEIYCKKDDDLTTFREEACIRFNKEYFNTNDAFTKFFIKKMIPALLENDVPIKIDDISYLVETPVRPSVRHADNKFFNKMIETVFEDDKQEDKECDS